jgi:hypothetical protein
MNICTKQFNLLKKLNKDEWVTESARNNENNSYVSCVIIVKPKD